MRRVVVVLVALALQAPAVAAGAAVEARPPQYTNPVAQRDFPDPFLLDVGSTTYAYATNRGDNVQVMRSGDLARWEVLGDALPRLPRWAAPGHTWAPGVMAWQGGYVLFYAARHRPSGRQCISRATAPTPQGPFTDTSAGPLVCQLDRLGSIDPTPFVDDDGQPYLLWKSEGLSKDRARIWAQPLNADGVSLRGQPTELLKRDQAWEGQVIENPLMLRHEGRYYLFYSGNDWLSSAYALGWAVCESALGPCAKPTSEPFAKAAGPVAGPGAATVIRDPDGALWLGYHAWTAGRVGYGVKGARSLRIDKLAFVDGRPVLNGPSATPVSTTRANRVAGPDRYATAAAASAATFAPGVPVVHLAAGDGFADALAAGPVAAKRGGPVLLVEPDRMPEATAAELARLRPQEIVVLGGTQAVADEVVNGTGAARARAPQAEPSAGQAGSRGPSAGQVGPSAGQAAQQAEQAAVTRVAGADRYDTAARLSAATFAPGARVAYVTTGADFADALAAGPAAANGGAPVLLVDADRVPEATAAELSRLAPQQIVVLGGRLAVGDEVVDALRLLTPTGRVDRVSGADRYETAAATAALWEPRPDVAYVTTGTGFADALAAGPAAAAGGGPVLLVQAGNVPPATTAALKRLAPRSIVVLGGRSAVSDAVLANIDFG